MNTRRFLPNQYEFLAKKVYVAQNHPLASDENPGTKDKPMKTVSASMDILKMGDHIYISQGVYREEIPLKANGHPYVPNAIVHFHAEEGEEVYIKGSDVFAGPWRRVEGNVWEADLPCELFEAGVYNPYELALAKDVDRKVRPCDESQALEKTKGQLFVDGQACRQVCNVESVKASANTFVVSADGKRILANFGACEPSQCEVELTTRRRCIAPQFAGEVFVQTHGICIEHAAEPGPFCKDRSESVRENPELSGCKVVKEFCIPGAAGNGCSLMPGQVSYLSTEDDTLVASIADDTQPVMMFEQECMNATSADGGRTWELDQSSRIPLSQQDVRNYSLDERRGILMRHWIDHVHGHDPHGAFGDLRHNVMFQFSRDGGKSWSEPSLINDEKLYCLSIVPLADGSYLCPYYTKDSNYPANKSHFMVGVLLGRWDEEAGTIHWQKGGEISVSPTESACGIAEPSVVQFADGRLIMFLRAGSMLPSQHTPGATSVKLFSTSEDGGKTWAKPQPLCYKDGEYIYSPRAYHMAFRSIKNGKVYIVMNKDDFPCTRDCDPRTHLYLVEVDPQTLRVPRNGLTLIEGKHPEHHFLVRFSNFQLIQERKSGNPVVFMKLDKSENCMIIQGYDTSMYRYEIFLPE